MTTGEPLDIRSGAPGPAGVLGNFAPHPFTLDGTHLACMEAFLQGPSLRELADAAEQARVHAMSGLDAKAEGQKHDWQARGLLWWQGEALDRFGPAYQALLDRAYGALAAQNVAYRAALRASGSRPLIHTVGKTDPRETVLTIGELCDRLTRLRAELTEG